tara:strand:- start:975 stop:1487 length:513 start_codon:yes stop_codon:yes gene_type:complete
MPVIITSANYTITPLEAFLFFPACGQSCGFSGRKFERSFIRSSRDSHLWRYDASWDIDLPLEHKLLLEKRVVPSDQLPVDSPKALSAKLSDVMEEFIRFEWPGYYLSVQGIYKNRGFQDCRHYARVTFLGASGPETLEKRSFKLYLPRAFGELHEHVARIVPDVFFRPLF